MPAPAQHYQYLLARELEIGEILQGNQNQSSILRNSWKTESLANVSSKTATKDIKWGLDFAVLLLALNMRGLFSTILKVPMSPSHPEYPTSPEGLVPAFLIIGSVTFFWQLEKVPSLKLTARS